MPQRSSLGSVQEVGEGRFRVRVSAGRDSRTGKRIWLTRTVHGTRRDAETMRTRLLVEAGEMPERSSRMTLRDYVETIWMPSCERRLKRSTVAGYRSAMRPVLEAIGDVPLVDLAPSAVDSAMASIEHPGARKKSYASLRAALRYAMRRRLVSRVATDAVDVPKVPRYSAETLDAAQVRQVLAAFRNHQVEPAILLALGCGLRRSEICALDWEDVDLDAREVSVTKRYLVVDGEHDMDTPKTRNSERVVSIPPSFAARLAEVASPSGPLLPTPGGRMAPDSLTRAYERRCREAGCMWVPLKNLRHTHATLMLDSGVDVVSVSRRLGHSSVSTTDAFYLRPRRSADERAASAFDGLGVLG